MAKLKPYINDDGEVRELDSAFAKTAKRGRPSLPESDRKVRMNFMIDPNIASALQGRANMSAVVNEALRKVLA